MQNAPVPNFEVPGVRALPRKLEHGFSPFDLTVALVPSEDGGFSGTFRYAVDLFRPSTIRGMIGRYLRLLSAIAANPDQRVSLILDEAFQADPKTIMKPKKSLDSMLANLSSSKPQPVTRSGASLVKRESMADLRLPCLFTPAVPDLNLAAWAEENKPLVDQTLHQHGALLFRGFQAADLDDLQAFAKATSRQLMDYGERSSPRTSLKGRVYTSTDHPANQPILLHCEQSYTLNWPMRIWFYCQEPAQSGGATPLADTRRILARLAPEIVERFARRQVMYVRNYGDGLGLSWREAFQTEDRAEAERQCRAAKIDFQWIDNRRLRTRQIRPAIRTHPTTGEKVWFNHALFFNVLGWRSQMGPAAAEIPEENLPYNTYYGDGSPIAESDLEAIGQAYEAETVRFDWRRFDVLLVDNMLVAHGREAFTGPRRIAVVLADPCAGAPGSDQR